MKTVTTEDIVNEICKACTEALDDADKFSIFDGEVREIYKYNEEDKFYPHGESILVIDLEDLSIDSRNFLSDVAWFKDDMALIFFVENDTIKMDFCHNDWDGFQSELSFTFKKTFDDDLFD